jgi:hypothetical protein
MELSVVALGHVHTEAIEPLTAHLTRLEQVMTNLAPRVALLDVRAELNRAIDAAAHDWILILREREFVDAALAAEVAGAMKAADAWGFRIRVLPLYAGKPLRLSGDAGELRLFHRRHLMRRGELGVQGTVVRLRNAIQARTFDSPADHRAYLEKNAIPHSSLRRTLLFLRYARTLDANTLRYLWIEAGFDSPSPPSPLW